MSAHYGAYTRITGRVAALSALTAAATLVATHSGGAAAAAAAFDGGTDITTTADGAQSVVAADLDGDGDIDLAAASFEDDTISWYSNNGSGSFTASIVTTSANGAQSVTAGDFDGDGDIDLASASLLDDTIAWYPNAGSGSFGLAFDIDTNADGASAVIAADLDGDGDIDLASASRYDDTIAWYENNGGGLFTASDIATSADVASSVTAADLDGDGDIDLASASYVDDTIAWYQNDGTGSFTATDISTSANGARSVIAADLDGDGDVDLASASYVDDKIAWYQNNGAGFFSPSTVSTSADGASAVTAADFDDDGDIDLASASSNDSKIAWYENDGAGSFTATTIATSANGAQAVAAADYDNDGDIDLASASYFDDTIAWYENSVGVDAGGPYELEDGASIALQATTNAPPGTTLTLTWDFDDDGSYDDAAGYTPTFDSTVFGVVGVNTVSVRATDGGALTVFDTTTVKINVDPVVDAGGPYTLDVNATLVLAATAADADGGTPAVVWDLDDDGAFDDATGLTPTFDTNVFGSIGVNTITVRATDDEGATAVVATTVAIGFDPLVDAGGPYMVDSTTTVSLAATASDPDGGTPTLAWDFDGDGQFDDATGLTPTFDPSLFGAPGSNTVAVQATDDEGVTATDTATVTIETDPVVDPGGPYTVADTATVALAATTSDPDGGTSTLAWDFDGDGQFDDGTGLTPTFDTNVFGAPGSNTISVQATDDEGATTVETTTVTITNDPIVDAGGPYTVEHDATVSLAATASDPDGGTPTLAWDFDGDGQFDDATGLTPTFDPSLFGAPGSNTVAVQATDDEGVTATDTATVTIKTDPLVDAGGPYTVEEDRRVRLAATTSDPDGGTPTLAWDFDGDGLFDDDTDDNPQFDSKDFGAPGENIVTVQATDDEGETVTDTAIVKITTDPVVDAGGPYTVFGGATVTLSATTSDADGGTPDLAWDFDDDGDFDDATGATPTFDTNTFGDPGQNDIAVQATDDEGVIETDSTRLTIVAILGATFDPGPATSLDPERFVDTRSTGATFDQRFQGEGMRLAGSDYRVAIAGRGGVPVDAVAVVANITAVRPQANGFITAHPCLAPRPLASSLNYSANVNLGNEVIIPLTSDGEICLYTRSSTHMTIDVSGYIDVQSPIELISPARFLDTRATGETIDGSAQARGRVNAGTTYRLDVAGRGDIPDDAAAVIVNVTAVGADATGYVTVHPCLATTPNAASLNYIAGVNRGNETIAQLDANGDLCLFTRSNVHLTADISGYLSSGGAVAAVDSEAITLEPVGPSRFVDTRFSGTTVDGFDQAIGQLRAGSQIRIQVAGRDGIPSNVDTVELNVTAIQAEANGYITIHPCQDPRPNIASLNYVAGVNGGNAVLTRLDSTGHMCIFSLSATQLTIDITNYVSPAPA